MAVDHYARQKKPLLMAGMEYLKMSLQLDPKAIKEKIITPVLNALELDRDTLDQAVELLLGTAAAESTLGLNLRQIGGGPALGLYGIEPETEGDVWKNFLLYRPRLASIMRGMKAFQAEEMMWNHTYSTAIARLIYYRAPEKLPALGDLDAQATFWKLRYNTPNGKGTTDYYKKCWTLLVKGKI